jgi:IS1 family transposase
VRIGACVNACCAICAKADFIGEHLLVDKADAELNRIYGSVLIWIIAAMYLVGVVPAFAKVQSCPSGGREYAAVAKSEIGEPLFPECVLILNSSVYVDRSCCGGDVGYFYSRQGTIKPQYFIESCPRPKSIVERAVHGWEYQHIFSCYPDDGNLCPTHNVIGRSLAEVFYEHSCTRNTGSGRLRRVQHGAINERGVFLQNISTQLPFGTLAQVIQGRYSDPYSTKSHDKQRPFGSPRPCIPFWRLLLGGACFVLGVIIAYGGKGRVVRSMGYRIGFASLPVWFIGLVPCQRAEQQNADNLHSVKIVTQKHLTTCTYCITVSDMANVLSAEKQTAIIAALAEGSSIRSIERITGVHRDTIMRLGVKVGQGCTALLDEKMRNLPCRLLQFDEIWGFIGKKERHVRPDDDPQYGNVWTFCAIDAETKLVPSFKCGKRDLATAKTFVADVQSRMTNRVQISADALRAYVDAIEQTFGADVDFGQIVKTYEHDDSQNAERKYSAAKFVSVEKRSVTGSPDMDFVSTSYIERLNATTRLHMRRLTRLTLAFSKKLENFEAAVGLHFAYYNFVKRHNSLRCTPAMAAGIERDFWSVADLVEASS